MSQKAQDDLSNIITTLESALRHLDQMDLQGTFITSRLADVIESLKALNTTDKSGD